MLLIPPGMAKYIISNLQTWFSTNLRPRTEQIDTVAVRGKFQPLKPSALDETHFSIFQRRDKGP